MFNIWHVGLVTINIYRELDIKFKYKHQALKLLLKFNFMSIF